MCARRGRPLRDRPRFPRWKPTCRARYQMTGQLPDWQSFWDIATPAQGATAMVEIYGPGAATAVLTCAAAAANDERQEDYQFWRAVLTCLQAVEPSSENIAA